MNIRVFSSMSLLLVAACGGNSPESASPVAIKPGNYAVAQTGGHNFLEPFEYCLKPSEVGNWPHSLAKKILAQTEARMEGCSRTAGDRTGNLASTTFLCRFPKAGPDYSDTEYAYRSTLAADSVELIRTQSSKSRPGASAESKAGDDQMNDAYRQVGGLTFSATRKSDC